MSSIRWKARGVTPWQDLRSRISAITQPVMAAGLLGRKSYGNYLYCLSAEQSEKYLVIHPAKSIFNSNTVLILFYLIFIFIIEMHIFIYHYFPLDKGGESTWPDPMLIPF